MPAALCVRPVIVLFAAGLFAAHATLASQPLSGGDTARVVVDAGVMDGPKLKPELFGVAWNWTDSGGGLMEFGELLRDRSFRNQGELYKRAWMEAPDTQARGRVRRSTDGGDQKPWGGTGYPGFMRLSQESPGSTCIAQTIHEPIEAGAEYELHLSARGAGGGASLTAYLADANSAPLGSAVTPVPVAASAWKDYRFVMGSPRTVIGGSVRVCLTSAGELALDEVRLRRLGGESRVRAEAAARIQDLGVKSLRWPTGSDADHFEWRASIGPVPDRGEIPTQFGVYQVANLGLHEFLDFCEQHGIVPLVTVNIRQSAEESAALVEYILGSRASAMGALRARNGRANPWNVRHFELGNEPTELYRADFGSSETAKGYVKLAKAAAEAMRAKARELDKTVELKGVVEATFAVADWIWLVPMLSKWNKQVLDRDAGLRASIDQIKGNFYSAFTWKSSERELYEEVMGGGATLAATVRSLTQEHGPQPPFWLTEYGVLIKKKRFLGGDEILLERAKDFQAGLSAADLLLTSIQERFGGAYLFNLAQWGTWGVLGNPRDLRLRPAGHAFRLISRLAGEALLPTTVEGGKTVRLTSGEGNNPSKMQYRTMTAVATRSDNAVQVVLLNRSFASHEKVRVDLQGFAAVRAEVARYGPEALDASNERKVDAVAVHASVEEVAEVHRIELPARSLLRIRYLAR